MSPLVRELAQVLSTRFAGVMQSVVTPEAEALPFDGAVAPGWLVPCELAGPIAGTWYLAITSDDAARLASRVLMKETASPDEIGEALKELTAQALSRHRPRGAVHRAGGQRRQAGDGAGRAGHRRRQLRLPPRRGEHALLRLQLRRRFGRAGPSAGGAAAPAPSRRAGRREDAGQPRADPRHRHAADRPLRRGHGVDRRAVAGSGPGSLVELSRQPDDPVDVLINGRLVARGEVVVVAGNYGVRVTQVVSADERMRTLNG